MNLKFTNLKRLRFLNCELQKTPSEIANQPENYNQKVLESYFDKFSEDFKSEDSEKPVENKKNLNSNNSSNGSKNSQGIVVYWMDKERRVQDNWALIHAAEVAKNNGWDLVVVFALPKAFLGSIWRAHHFMLEGLREVADDLEDLNIPFFLILEDPGKGICQILENLGSSESTETGESSGSSESTGSSEKSAFLQIKYLVSDFSPLKVPRSWRDEVSNFISTSNKSKNTDADKISKKYKIPYVEIDARNIVPCWLASEKKEFGAYTLRPKIHKKIPEFLDQFPDLKKDLEIHKINENYKDLKSQISKKLNSGSASQNSKEIKIAELDHESQNKYLTIKRYLKIPTEIDANSEEKYQTLEWIKPGEIAAQKKLQDFLENKLENYAELRNDPTKDQISDLSPYLHFGQISAQRIALETKKIEKSSKSKKNSPQIQESIDSFLEELIVRRELSDNFCFYEPNYDNFEGFHDWAKKSLSEHKKDQREYIYTEKQFEEAKTHDELWNAAQQQLLETGKIHGYMRMYWAKKILEWSNSPEEAQKIAIYLNDKYHLDGCDSNGYTGVAWSIGGIHDRAWTERPVYGKIRYMNANGCKRKFDVEKYLEKWL